MSSSTLNSTSTTSPQPLPVQSPSVLCVDLDGTLLATDVLWESILLISKQQPWALLVLPFWFLRGRAYLKRQIAKRVILDPAELPYRQDVLAHLHEQKEAGHTLILATASDRQPAEAIAAYLGIFSKVIASDGITNLSGQEKRAALEAEFGEKGFNYMGNSHADLDVWPSAHAAILVNPTRDLLARAQVGSTVKRIFPRPHNVLRNFVKALRFQQWVKNILVFLPLITAHQLSDGLRIFQASSAFMAFSFCASSLYILNDLLDLQADRRHPQKMNRPFASGALSIPTGLILIPILLVCALGTSWLTLPQEFITLLGLYALTTFCYSSFLKQIPIMDVLTLAGLYTLRVIAGGYAVQVPISAWLLAFSMFFFLSLAFAKRRSELQYRNTKKYQGLERRGYIGIDKEALGTMGTVSGYLSVLILALYINNPEVLTLYRTPQLLWFICPFLLYWISRIWLMAHRGKLNDDPLVTALKDPQSYAIAAAISLMIILAI